MGVQEMETFQRRHKKVWDSRFFDFAIFHNLEHLAPDCGVHFGNEDHLANHVMLGNAWEVQGFYYRTNLHHVVTQPSVFTDEPTNTPTATKIANITNKIVISVPLNLNL